MKVSQRIFLVFLATLCGVFFYPFLTGSSAVLASVVPADLVVCPDPEARTSRATLLPATLGEQVLFFVEPAYDQTGRSQLAATLKAIGTRSLIYVEDSYFGALSGSEQQALLASVETLKNEFDTVLYPRLTAFWGPPWEPGIDGDMRVTILLTRMITNAGGYVDTSDEYLKTQASGSNEREMLYLNALYATQSRRINSFAAHEFTHLIDFNQKKKLRNVEDEIWLNELRADYAPTYAGYETPYPGSNLSSRVATFLANPSDSLIEWKNLDADYGAVSMFAQYVAGHYGENVLAATMRSALVGIAALDSALSTVGTLDRFSDIVGAWSVANLIQTTQPGVKYSYTQPDLVSALRLVNPTITVNVGQGATVSMSRQIEDFTGQWIQALFSGGLNEALVVSVTATVPLEAQLVLSRIDGTREIQTLATTTSGASLTVGALSSYTSATIVPVFMGKTSGYSTGTTNGVYPDEPLRSYVATFQRVVSDTPLLTSIAPARVVSFGGAIATVRGSGFSNGALALAVDGVTVQATVIDDTTLTFTAPAHATGQACARVTVDGKSSERCDLLSYVSIADGSLIRGSGTPEVWIIRGKFRRHIVRGDILSFYPHLSWGSVQDVSQEVVEQFRLSAWVRLPVTADPITWRVYEVNADASKHWITCANPDQCGPTWLAHGGDPDGIFTANQREVDFYASGSNVFLQ